MLKWWQILLKCLDVIWNRVLRECVFVFLDSYLSCIYCNLWYKQVKLHDFLVTHWVHMHSCVHWNLGQVWSNWCWQFGTRLRLCSVVFLCKIIETLSKPLKWISRWCWQFWAFLLDVVSMWLFLNIWSSKWQTSDLTFGLNEFFVTFGPLSSHNVDWILVRGIWLHSLNLYLSHWKD